MSSEESWSSHQADPAGTSRGGRHYQDYQGYRRYVRYEQQYEQQAQSQYPSTGYEDPGYASYDGSYGSYASYDGAQDQSQDQSYPQGYDYAQDYGQGYESSTQAYGRQSGSYHRGYGSGYGGDQDPLSGSQGSTLSSSHGSGLSDSQAQAQYSAADWLEPAAEPEADYGFAPEAEPEPAGRSADRADRTDRTVSAHRSEPVARAAARDGEDGDDRQRRPAAPKKRGRKRLGFLVALVIAGGSAAYVYSGNAHKSADGAGAGPNGSAASGSGSASGSTGASGTSGSTGSGTGASSGAPSSAGLAGVAKIILPASVDGLTQMTNSTGRTVVQAMTKANSSSPDLSNALVDAYEKSGSSSFFADLTLVQLSKAPDFQSIYQSAGPAAALKTLGASSFSDEETITTKVPGSAMACGLSSAGGVILRKCIWLDPSEYGLFAAVKTVGNSDAAAFAEAIETASEGA